MRHSENGYVENEDDGSEWISVHAVMCNVRENKMKIAPCQVSGQVQSLFFTDVFAYIIRIMGFCEFEIAGTVDFFFIIFCFVFFVYVEGGAAKGNKNQTKKPTVVPILEIFRFMSQKIGISVLIALS